MRPSSALFTKTTAMDLIQSRRSTDDRERSLSLAKRQRQQTSARDNDDDRKDQQPLTHRDYTVGWICALSIELSAARVLLDDIHETLPTSRDDTNTYTLGNMGMHNIVIACLPQDRYGLTNAATVANNMHRSFPSIRFGLMVGIGGGVPGKVDVRLGDVVVSKEVVQYDFGKTTQEGAFHRTGTLNKPPHSLSTAVTKLQASHRSEPSMIPSILDKMLERYPHMINLHILEISKIGCLMAHMLMFKKATIASANQVMKSGRIRDQLADELDVLCFEMEAAGLMDGFPCFIVRGICDYSDSHKNKQWQDYAAATAAAYAKELLSVVSHDTDQKHDGGVPVTNAQNLIDTRKRLIERLQFDRIYTRRLGMETTHQETCKWLLDDPVYKRWLDPARITEHNGFLWIKGSPGAGKSSIMNFAYSNAKDTMDNTIVISFFFNARGEDLEKSTVGMYRSLVWQLVMKVPQLQMILDHEDLIPLSHCDHPIWEIETVRSLFSEGITNLGQLRLLCFVDALDECDQETVHDMIENFQELGKSAVTMGIPFYVCFSSRHYPFVDKGVGQELVLERHLGHENDIETYIYTKLKLRNGSKTKADGVRNEIRTRANGTFLWVKLVVKMLNEEFRKASSISTIRARLREIPVGLSQLFQDMLRRDSEDPENLLLSIEWILYAKRPLKWEELYFALISGQPHALTVWDCEDLAIQDIKDFILSFSKGLAEITRPESETVQFIHESVRDFLLKDGGLRDLRRDLLVADENFESLAHDRLKECCHRYIKFDPMAQDLRYSISERFPFLEYATRNILLHANGAGNEIPQQRFLEDLDLNVWIRLNNLFQQKMTGRYTLTASLLYIIAERNLTNLIKPALCIDSRLNIKGERYHYPIFAALANNHRGAAVELLQQKGIIAQECDISTLLKYGQDLVSYEGHTPLSRAAEAGDKDLVILLLATGIDINLKNGAGQTPLSLAAREGHETLVPLLLKIKGVVVESKDILGRTPLSWAAEKGYESIVKPLLRTGASMPMPKTALVGHHYYTLPETPLLVAAKNGHEDVVASLLNVQGIDPDSKDVFGQTPLSWAAERGFEGVMVLLLANQGVNVDCKDTFGWTPLFYSVSNNFKTGVRLLLERGADTGTKDNRGRTPLPWAAEEGNEDIVAVMLTSNNVDVNSKDETGQTPLFSALKNGYMAIEMLLHVQGVSVVVRDGHGLIPLSYAIREGNESVAQLLLHQHNDINKEGNRSRMAPQRNEFVPDYWQLQFMFQGKQANNHRAMAMAREFAEALTVVQLLLEKGADVEAKNIYGQTPLSWAIENGHMNVVQLLQTWRARGDIL
ncbi:hypothetical protein ACLX1H_010989 [Fusarium chlamydosporum]